MSQSPKPSVIEPDKAQADRAQADRAQADGAQADRAQAGTPQAGTSQAGTPQAGTPQAGTMSWQAVQEEALRRIRSRQWLPGEQIPNEAELSRELGCARATVNRALRNLAEAGILDRRRKAGTRVALHPVRKATLDIPVIRQEIEGKAMGYSYTLLSRHLGVPPMDLRARLQSPAGQAQLHVSALHLADGRPYVFEDRWINPQAVPAALDADFALRSANEWLIEQVPVEGGQISFSAKTASDQDAEILACQAGEGLFVIDRTTWSGGQVITLVRLVFHPGYHMHTQL